MPNDESEVLQLIQDAQSVEELLSVIQQHIPFVYPEFNVTKQGFALRKLKRIELTTTALHDPIFITQLIDTAKFDIKQKYTDLVESGRLKSTKSPDIIVPTWQNASSVGDLLSQYESICKSKRINEDEIDLVKGHIKMIFTKPIRLHEIYQKKFNWEQFNIPVHFGLREEIFPVASMAHEQNISNLHSSIANTNTMDELTNVFVQNSLFIDAISEFGDSSNIISDIYRFTGKMQDVANLYDQQPIDWDHYPHLTKNLLLHAQFIKLAIDFEAKRRQALAESIQAAHNFEELVQAIDQYTGELDKVTLIKNIRTFTASKKNLQYLAQAQDIDWEKTNIPREFGITDKITEIAVKLHSQPRAQSTDSSIRVTDDEWAQVAQLFSQNSEKAKLDKKEYNLSHSFIRIGAGFYALQNKDYLGEGNYGKVKLIMNQAGQQFAVKIEGAGLAADNQAEKEIMQLVGLYIGEMQRQYGKEFKGRLSAHKLYTLMKLLKGHELHDHLYFGQRLVKKEVDEGSRLLIAIKAAEAIQFLHDNRIVHCDIKPENFMMNVDGDQITISSFDFGFSVKLPVGEDSIMDKPKGSDFYLAPEIEDAKYSDNEQDLGEFSFASDVFALGKMFEHDLELSSLVPDSLLSSMVANSKHDRPTLFNVLEALYIVLANSPNKTVQMQKLLDEHSQKQRSDTPSKRRSKSIISMHKTTQSSISIKPPKTGSISKIKSPKSK